MHLVVIALPILYIPKLVLPAMPGFMLAFAVSCDSFFLHNISIICLLPTLYAHQYIAEVIYDGSMCFAGPTLQSARLAPLQKSSILSAMLPALTSSSSSVTSSMSSASQSVAVLAGNAAQPAHAIEASTTVTSVETNTLRSTNSGLFYGGVGTYDSAG